MRKFVTGLIYCAMLKLYPYEKDNLNDYWSSQEENPTSKTTLGNFVLLLIYNLFELENFVANFSQYFQLLARFSSLGAEAQLFLLKAKAIGRLMEFFYHDVSPHKLIFTDMSEINPVVNLKPDLGLPTKSDPKQLSHF